MRLLDALIPVISSAIAIWAVASYSITEEKSHEIRLEQEAMRGEAERIPLSSFYLRNSSRVL